MTQDGNNNKKNKIRCNLDNSEIILLKRRRHDDDGMVTDDGTVQYQQQQQQQYHVYIPSQQDDGTTATTVVATDVDVDTQNNNSNDDEIIEVKDCWCARMVLSDDGAETFLQQQRHHISVNTPHHYCLAKYNVCELDIPSSSSSYLDGTTTSTTGPINIGCYHTSTTTSVVHAIWPLCVFWYITFLYLLTCTDPGQKCRGYIKRQLTLFVRYLQKKKDWNSYCYCCMPIVMAQSIPTETMRTTTTSTTNVISHVDAGDGDNDEDDDDVEYDEDHHAGCIQLTEIQHLVDGTADEEIGRSIPEIGVDADTAMDDRIDMNEVNDNSIDDDDDDDDDDDTTTNINNDNSSNDLRFVANNNNNNHISNNSIQDFPFEFGSIENFNLLQHELYRLNSINQDYVSWLWYSAITLDRRRRRWRGRNHNIGDSGAGGAGIGGQRNNHRMMSNSRPNDGQASVEYHPVVSTGDDDFVVPDMDGTNTSNNRVGTMTAVQTINNNGDDYIAYAVEAGVTSWRNRDVSFFYRYPPPHVQTQKQLILPTKRFTTRKCTSNVKSTSSSDNDTNNTITDNNDDGPNDIDDDSNNCHCCSICLCDIEEDEIVGVIPCGHYFHKDCLKVWVRRNNRCPLCQQPDIATPKTALIVGTTFSILS